MEEKILAHYSNWLKLKQQSRDNEPPTSADNNQNATIRQSENEGEMETENRSPSPNSIENDNNEEFFKFPIDSHNEIKVFENDEISVYIKKSFHNRQVRFRLQDSMYHIKVKTKQDSNKPLLFNLLEVFQRAFTFILKNLQTYYNKEDINEIYLTLFQDNFLNGLNSPAVRLQDNPQEVVDNILDMLYRFLISEQNINIEINDSFTVYIHILSIDHMEHRKRHPPRKQKRKLKKYGGRKNKSLEEKKFFWGIDVPDGFGQHPKLFKNKCLLVSVILSHLQNEYFRTNKIDRRFMYAQNINSTCRSKKMYAGNIILKELLKLSTSLSLKEGPFEINTIALKLCEYYNCQLFIFRGLEHQTRLKASYPSAVDTSREPIYLFEKEANHIIFIRSISSFFKSNGRICVYCKIHYKCSTYIHRCIP